MSDKKEDKERRRRRRDEGGEVKDGQGEERRRRRRDEAAANGNDPKPEAERRRRRDEAPAEKDRPRQSPTDEGEKPETTAAAQKPADKQPPPANVDKPGSPDRPNEIGLTYTAYSRQRRALDKYEKKCSYDQLLDKLHTEQFMELMAGKFKDRDHAKREKERCKTTEPMAKKANTGSSSAGIMTDFYQTLLQWGGVPVPSTIRDIVDGVEKRYRTEKKAEKERRDNRERAEAEAKAQEVEEAPPEADDEYEDEAFENEEEEFDPNVAYINTQISLMMNKEFQSAKQTKKDREKAEIRRGSTPQALQPGIELPERKGMDHAAVLSKKQKMSHFDRQNKRAQEILQLVPLDCVSYDMVEIQPITEYELYIRHFGSSNTEQCATQVPDETEIDNTAVQTDEITLGDHAAQVPEDIGLNSTEGETKNTWGRQKRHIDTARLPGFVANCAGVFRVLLDEVAAGANAATTKSTTSFSSRITTLNTEKYLGGRGTISVVFSRVALQYLVTIHGKAKGDSSLKGSQLHHYDGLCIVWNINNPTTADKICITGGTITSATFSPHNGNLLYGGSNNGSTQLWDLREPDYVHNPSRKAAKGVEILRMPTYSTDHLPADNHCCAIRRILPVGYNNILMGAKDESSEQVATLDEMGNVNIWIVVDVQDKKAFEKDYGLNIGGSMRLFRSATVAAPQTKIRMEMTQPPSGIKVDDGIDPFAEKPTKGSISPSLGGKRRQTVAGDLWEGLAGGAAFPEVCAYDLEFQPDDAAQFLIASDSGYIIHSSRFGDGAIPSRYRASAEIEDVTPKHGVHVLTLHYAATDNRLFLAGLSDGTINLYKTGWGTPIFTLEGFTKHPIIVARWSIMHRGVCWALDSGGTLFMFDLIEDDPAKRAQPVLTENCCVQTNGKTSYPNDLDFSHDEREPKVAISYSCGRVDLHILKNDLLKGRSSSSNGEMLNSVF